MLYIPSPRLSYRTDFSEVPVKTGQLYNLDDDKSISFQFNPSEFSWQEEHNWSTQKYTGNPGKQLQYLGCTGRVFTLELEFHADPWFPRVQLSGDVDPSITPDPDRTAVDFDKLVDEFRSWIKERPDKKRPSYIRIILPNKEEFDGIVRSATKQILSVYADGVVQHGKLIFNFEEWKEIS